VGLTVLGLSWAGCLSLLGIHALTLSRATPLGVGASVVLWLGVFLVSAGNFVFMELVADRVLQIKRRLILDIFELLVAVVMLLAGAAFVSFWLISGATA